MNRQANRGGRLTSGPGENSPTNSFSVDEMTGIQALERNAKTMPIKPGQLARIEFEYTRHGTLCLTGNWHVVLGQMIAPTVRATRTEGDFCWHIHQTVATDPEAGWVFVVDNLNTHCSESLVRYVARLEGIDSSTLGQKDKSGILKSMASLARSPTTGRQRPCKSGFGSLARLLLAGMVHLGRLCIKAIIDARSSPQNNPKATL